MTDVPKDLENLCDKEFALARRQAYDGLDRVLAAFETCYLGKWADSDRELRESDRTWLVAKANDILDPEIREAGATCNSALWDRGLTFVAFWQNAEAEARKRRGAILEKIEILRLQKQEGQPPMKAVSAAPAEPSGVWNLLHPIVVKVAKPRFDSGHFADSVEAALKEVNDIVRTIVKDRTGEELDGADLMNKAFSPKNPVIVLDDMATVTGRNIQQGYMLLFAGSMTGVRNPKAHANIDIDERRALHFLFLASLLLFKIDEKTK